MATVETCSTPYRYVEGVGNIAKFDKLSDIEACKELYDSGTAYERNELVRRFCDSFDKDNIPKRCECYRFKDTPEYAKYTSLWNELIDKNKGDIAGDPLGGNYACFLPACSLGNEQDVYKTTDIRDMEHHCPDLVYCKQEVGGATVDVKNGGIASITERIIQKCGHGVTDEPEDEDKPKGMSVGDKIQWATLALAAIIVVLLLLR